MSWVAYPRQKAACCIILLRVKNLNRPSTLKFGDYDIKVRRSVGFESVQWFEVN